MEIQREEEGGNSKGGRGGMRVDEGVKGSERGGGGG